MQAKIRAHNRRSNLLQLKSQQANQLASGGFVVCQPLTNQ